MAYAHKLFKEVTLCQVETEQVLLVRVHLQEED